MTIDTEKPARRASLGDMILSVALPLAVIALGVALSVGTEGGIGGFIDLCRSVLTGS